MIFDQKDEIFGVSTIAWDQTPWMTSTLIHENAIKLSTAKIYVFSNSVLCFGGIIADYPPSVKSWTDKSERFTHSTPYRELERIDGEPVVFEWMIFPGYTTLELIREVQNMMQKELGVLPRDFKDRVIFISMYNDTDWNQTVNE